MQPVAAEWWLRPVSKAARVGEHSAVVWKRVYRRPFLASLSRLGVGTCPPKVPHCPKPQSSMRMRRTFGAPSGALITGILDGVESFANRSILPVKGDSGGGKTCCALVVDAHTALKVSVSAINRFFVFMSL